MRRISTPIEIFSTPGTPGTIDCSIDMSRVAPNCLGGHHSTHNTQSNDCRVGVIMMLKVDLGGIDVDGHIIECKGLRWR